MIDLSYITVKVNGNAINEGACGKYGYQVVSAGRDPEFVVAAGDTSAQNCLLYLDTLRTVLRICN